LGVKISTVKDKNTGKAITVKDCEKGHDGEYICKTDGCNAQMSFVKAHEKRRLDKTIEISSFFKLKSNEKHSYKICPYNTKGAVEIIARDSDSNILKAIDNEKYEFSLQVLHKVNNTQEKRTEVDSKSSANECSAQKGKAYTRSGTASSYIKTLTQILTLRAQLEDNQELASLITLTYKKSKIKWSNFYFDIDDYIGAYEITKNSKISYPMCFHGVVSKTVPPSEKFKYAKFTLHSPYIELESELTDIPSLEFIIADDSLDLNNLPVGAEVLVYGVIKVSSGNWIPPEQKELDNPKSIRFLNMRAWINHAEQIAKL